MMAGVLAGRRVLVTGAAHARSIGDAIARRCVREGARVALTSRRGESARAAAARLVDDGFDATGHSLDVTDDESVAALLAEVGAVDGIVHNAGLPVTTWDRGFLEVPLSEMREAFETDLLGSARVTRAFLPLMVEKQAGALVFTSSTPALAGYDQLHEFVAAKAGILGIMRGLAAEFGREGIRSNAVAYGNIASGATWDALDAQQRDVLAAESPMGRWGEPREAAGASVFLLSDLASFVNGQVLVVDGGSVMR